MKEFMLARKRVLYLCSGLQSSGTTLVSWCFLQRKDLDGVLDANSEIFADLSFPLTTSFTWLKVTTVSFRASEQKDHFQDLGWTVRPLLICRDVREVYASLRRKEYGRNGTTAEDPPLRLRFRRFREDWELFQQKGWPIIQFNRFLHDPETVLRAACAELDLPWDEAMLTWPKPRSVIRDPRFGNETFNRSCSTDLRSTLASLQKPKKALADLIIPPCELVWLEKEFGKYNQVNGFPAHVLMRADALDLEDRDIPSYSVTRRCKKMLRRSPLEFVRYRIGRLLYGKTS